MDYRALLTELAVPRLVGSPNHARVRDVLKRELAARGFVVLEHRFSATPNQLLHPRAPVEGMNLIAVRPRSRVATWLVAHYDSKRQAFSMAGRLALVLATVGSALLAVPLAILGWRALGWMALMLAAGFAIAFGALNRVEDGSPGAVDNASGLLAVLATLDALPPSAPVGALLTDAEELGLLGARALVRDRRNLLADTAVINFDGIDDRGCTIAFLHRPGQVGRAVAQQLRARRFRLLPVLVDGISLAGAARECVTLLKGDVSTMRVVHTAQDVGPRLGLDGVAAVSSAVAIAIERFGASGLGAKSG